MGIQPKARPDVPSQQMTEFAGLGGGKAPKSIPVTIWKLRYVKLRDLPRAY